MAKRKRRAGGGAKVRPVKDYRDDEYVPYIYKAEGGILEAWTINPDIRDGDVREALRGLISAMNKSEQLPKELTAASESSAEDDRQHDLKSARTIVLIQHYLLTHLRQAFQELGPLSVTDTVGILRTINSSVGTWNRGRLGQEYLKYISDFIGGMGPDVRYSAVDEAMLPGPAEADNLPEGD